MQIGRPAKCPFCGGFRSSLKGWRKNQNGAVRIRKCKQCNRRWTPKAKQYRVMRIQSQAAEENRADAVAT